MTRFLRFFMHLWLLLQARLTFVRAHNQYLATPKGACMSKALENTNAIQGTELATVPRTGTPAIPHEAVSTEPITQAPTAVPAVRVPEAEDYETWPDEALIQRGQTRIMQADRHDERRIALGRQTIEERLDAGHPLSIVRRRHKEDGQWCAIQDKYNLPRTTVWEVIEAYERSTAAGHSPQEVVASHENWTEVLVAYAVVRRKKRSMHAPVQAELVDEEDVLVGPVEAVTTASNAGQDGQQEGVPVAADLPTDPSEGTAPIQAEPHEGGLSETDTGDAKIEAPPAQAEPASATTGTAHVGCGAKPAAKAAKAKKVEAKDQGNLTPCEIDAGNNLLKVAGSWDRAMHVLQTLKNVVGG